jgi:hypothetical protein
MAMVRFYDSDDDGATAAYAAVRALQPGWQPSSTLLPHGHPLRTFWEASSLAGDARSPASWRPIGGWFVDGLAANDLPTTRAYVLQGEDVDGRVVMTRYMGPTDALPTADELGVDAAPVTIGEGGRERPVIQVSALAMASGGVVAGSQSPSSDAWSSASPALSTTDGAGGGALFVRGTWSLVGAELGVQFAGGAPELAGGAGLAGRFHALVGPSVRLSSDVHLAPRLRLGVATDALTRLEGEDDPATTTRFVGPSAGVEVALDTAGPDALLSVTHALAGFSSPHATSIDGRVTLPIADPLVFAAGVSARLSSGRFAVEGTDEIVGKRSDVVVLGLVGVGVAL